MAREYQLRVDEVDDDVAREQVANQCSKDEVDAIEVPRVAGRRREEEENGGSSHERRQQEDEDIAADNGQREGPLSHHTSMRLLVGMFNKALVLGVANVGGSKQCDGQQNP
eukprot:2948947-Prymnesium_polylepis.1